VGYNAIPGSASAGADHRTPALHPAFVAYLLAFFHAEEKAELLPSYSYRIVDSKTISLAMRGERKPAQFFNNRSLEKLFHEFQSVKFFLTRDHLREVIVRR
jgi:hypothetical protein